MKKVIFAFFGMLFTISSLMAGGDQWNWGDNPEFAKSQYMNLERLVKMKKWEEAGHPLSWLFAHTKDLNEALYIYGEKVYKGKISIHKTDAKLYQDSLLWVYDMRIKHFGNEAYVLNRKGLVAYKYTAHDAEHMPELYNLYAKINELNGTKSSTYNAYMYMKTSCGMLLMKKLQKEEVFNVYDKVNTVIEAHTTKYANNEKKLKNVHSYGTKVMKDLIKNVSLNCEDIHSVFGTKFKEEKSTVMAQLIYVYSMNNTCFDELFLESFEFLQGEGAALTKEYGNIKTVANVYDKMAQQKNDPSYKEKSYQMYLKALNVATDSTIKANLYYELATRESKKGHKVEARKYALKATMSPEVAGKAYGFIGDLYMYSNCSSDDILIDRAKFIAAYNMYKKAGYTSKMAEAKAQFPSTVDIFNRGKSKGDKVSTGCWIGETVSLMTRD